MSYANSANSIHIFPVLTTCVDQRLFLFKHDNIWLLSSLAGNNLHAQQDFLPLMIHHKKTKNNCWAALKMTEVSV